MNKDYKIGIVVGLAILIVGVTYFLTKGNGEPGPANPDAGQNKKIESPKFDNTGEDDNRIAAGDTGDKAGKSSGPVETELDEEFNDALGDEDGSGTVDDATAKTDASADKKDPTADSQTAGAETTTPKGGSSVAAKDPSGAEEVGLDDEFGDGSDSTVDPGTKSGAGSDAVAKKDPATKKDDDTVTPGWEDEKKDDPLAKKDDDSVKPNVDNNIEGDLFAAQDPAAKKRYNDSYLGKGSADTDRDDRTGTDRDRDQFDTDRSRETDRSGSDSTDSGDAWDDSADRGRDTGRDDRETDRRAPSVVPATGGTYVCTGDETAGFTSVAIIVWGRKYQRYVNLIADANPNVDSRSLRRGVKLKIPAKPTLRSARRSSDKSQRGKIITENGKRYYVVKSYDTLEKISRKVYKTIRGIKFIRKNNPGLNPRRLRIGQKLYVPDMPASMRTSNTSGSRRAPKSQRGKIITENGKRYYVIKSFDTLEKIAYKIYKGRIGINFIRKNNPGLNDRRLRLGQKIYIPKMPQSYRDRINGRRSTPRRRDDSSSDTRSRDDEEIPFGY